MQTPGVKVIQMNKKDYEEIAGIKHLIGIKITEQGKAISQEIKSAISHIGFYMLNQRNHPNKFIAECKNDKCMNLFEGKGLPKNWKFKKIFVWSKIEDFENLLLFCSKKCKQEGLKSI